MEEREKLKQELLEELKKEYIIKPKKDTGFRVVDIFDKYTDAIIEKCNVKLRPFTYKGRDGLVHTNDGVWAAMDVISTGVRKVVLLHFGYNTLQDVPIEKRDEVRKELERFIKEYILNE